MEPGDEIVVPEGLSALARRRIGNAILYANGPADICGREYVGGGECLRGTDRQGDGRCR